MLRIGCLLIHRNCSRFPVNLHEKRSTMSGRIINDKKKCKVLLKDLMDSVKECQNVYGKNKTLLATEKDSRYGGPSNMFQLMNQLICAFSFLQNQ